MKITDKDRISWLKDQLSQNRGQTILLNEKEYKLIIFGRGKNLLVGGEDFAMIVDINVIHDNIYKKTIRGWFNEDKKFTKKDREIMSKLAKDLYDKAYDKDATIK